ncbi:NAD(P)-binding protein [Auricularia subglabra TFB-10046 SS5]|nr:NAD(P)-binding protein [Auricularia subglabra TFB-10046 SS5]
MSCNTQPIRVGFVGLSAKGWASSALALVLFRELLKSVYILTAVSTTNATSAAGSAKKHSEAAGVPVKAFHGDTKQIARDLDVDLVALAIKTPAHAEAVRPVIEAGKDVFVEWPLGKSLAETVELAQLAKEKGVRTLVGLQSWQSPLVTKVREFIAEGKIGRVLSAAWVAHKGTELPFWAPIHVESEWNLDPANDAPAPFLHAWALHGVIGHNVSAFTRMLGPLASVSATATTAFPKPTRTVPSPFPDHYAFSGPLSDHPGALFTALFGTGGVANPLKPTFTFIVDGDKGSVVVESYAAGASYVHIAPPEKIYLNGEEVKLEDVPFVGTVQRNWAA